MGGREVSRRSRSTIYFIMKRDGYGQRSSYEGDTKNNSEAWRHGLLYVFVLVILSSNTNMKFPIFFCVEKVWKMVVHRKHVPWPPLALDGLWIGKTLYTSNISVDNFSFLYSMNFMVWIGFRQKTLNKYGAYINYT